jgi:repressor LexA
VTQHDLARPLHILEYIASRKLPPTVREIMNAVGLSSTSAVHHHLVSLERSGLIERAHASARGIRLTAAAHDVLGDEVCPTCHGTGVVA